MADTSNARTPPAGGFGRWPFWKRWFGQRSERAAAKFLRRAGYRILAANVADQLGEIDLLALAPDRVTLVVVEVRSTSGPDPRPAAESVNLVKQKKLTEATLRFLARRHLLGTAVRFDVLAIAWPPGQREPTVQHIPHAFEATGRFQMYS
ncbi:MAG: YraN family protein [Gemmataceae bacterium]